MRQIGQGQTIVLLTTSQVYSLAQRQISKANPGGKVVMGSAVGDVQERTRLLCNIASWLLINRMRSERLQVRCFFVWQLRLHA